MKGHDKHALTDVRNPQHKWHINQMDFLDNRCMAVNDTDQLQEDPMMKLSDPTLMSRLYDYGFLKSTKQAIRCENVN